MAKNLSEKERASLEIFLELAFWAEQVTPEIKSSYAAFLYRWLELLEACQFIGEGLVLDNITQKERVEAALSSENLKDAKELVKYVKIAALNAVRGVIDQRCDSLEYEVKAMLDYDQNGEIVFRFNVDTSGKLPTPYNITSTAFLNLISYLHLEQSRFKKCPKCGKFFYQYNRKSKKFCSPICSDTGRAGKRYDTPI